MNIRGAPLIALVALLGLAVDLSASPAAVSAVKAKVSHLRTSRPTAVNLFNAMDELEAALSKCGEEDCETAARIAKGMAERYLAEDLAANKSLGDHGAAAIRGVHPGLSSFNLVTICNTGSLATAGHGTALGIIRSLHTAGEVASVAILETRPYNQGARLTAFEAVEEVRSA